MGEGTKSLMICPLCLTHNSKTPIHHLKKRDFFLCDECDLVFADPQKLVSGDAEKERYLKHQNDERDVGYIKFLSKLTNPLKNFIDKNSDGLDYGSGPYPMLKTLLEEEGYNIDAYDPFFSPIALKEKYDYIISTEVIEHFHNPHREFENILNHLDKNGILAIMTGIRYPKIDFKTWYYIQDDTHISLYSPKTIDWLCRKYQLAIIYQEKNIYFLKTKG